MHSHLMAEYLNADTNGIFAFVDRLRHAGAHPGDVFMEELHELLPKLTGRDITEGTLEWARLLGVLMIARDWAPDRFIDKVIPLLRSEDAAIWTAAGHILWEVKELDADTYAIITQSLECSPYRRVSPEGYARFVKDLGDRVR